jgi:hypothetical protein
MKKFLCKAKTKNGNGIVGKFPYTPEESKALKALPEKEQVKKMANDIGYVTIGGKEFLGIPSRWIAGALKNYAKESAPSKCGAKRKDEVSAKIRVKPHFDHPELIPSNLEKTKISLDENIRKARIPPEKPNQPVSISCAPIIKDAEFQFEVYSEMDMSDGDLEEFIRNAIGNAVTAGIGGAIGENLGRCDLIEFKKIT